MSSFTPLSRRHLLRGAGAALSLPLLESMLPRSWGAPSTFEPQRLSETVQPRMVCCYVPNGVNILDWMPADSGDRYTLSPTLAALADHRDHFTVVSGLGHPHSKGGHSGADTWLTGADLTARPGADYTNTMSIDQVVAATHGPHTRFPSLQLSDQSGTGAAGHSHTLSFDHAGTPLPAENSPRDSLGSDARALSRRLGATDQRKLEEYLSSVRDTEKQVERTEAWIDRPKPRVSEEGLQLGSKPGDAHDRPMWIDVCLELVYLALLTDTTRVVTFEWSREAGGFGIGGENHHELSHHGGDAGMLAKLAAIDKAFLEKLGRFLGMLSKTSEADGSMLDRTVVVYGSGMNSGKGGEHSPKNLPILVAGGKKLGFNLGRHLAFDEEKHPPLSNLLLSVARAVGCETETFSDATGTLDGLVG